MKSVIRISLILSICFSCNNENVDDCIMTCNSALGIQAEFNQSMNHYDFPCFNPNNPDEFLYVKRTFSNGDELYSLKTYNLVTHESDTLFEWMNYNITLGSRPKWGKQNYIVYSDVNNNQIYSMNIANQTITQLTSANSNFFPAWNYNGDKILYKKLIYPSLYICVLMDINGTSLDTIPDDTTNASMTRVVGLENGHFLCTYSDEYVYEYDENLDFVSKLNLAIQPLGDISGLENIWGTGKIVFKSGYGDIYIADLLSQATYSIYPHCDTRHVGEISVSPDGNKLLFSRLNMEKVNDCFYYSNYEIHLMNIDGTNDQILNLP